MGRGGFLVYPKIEGFAPEYVDREHVAYYKHGDFDSLKEVIDLYLENEEGRERIRNAGFVLTRMKNTYRNRWQSIIDTVFKEK